MGNLLGICYGIGTLPQAMLGVSTRTYISYLYTDILGLSTSIASLSWTFFCIINAFAEPFCGYYVDKAKGRV